MSSMDGRRVAASHHWGGAAPAARPRHERVSSHAEGILRSAGSLAEEILAACTLLKQPRGEQAAEQLVSTIRCMCEVVERHECGWLVVHGQCVEAANVEPHAVALLAAQEAVELVIAGHTIEEDS
jgi:hypothetical protein